MENIKNLTCANYIACPVFKGILQGKEFTSKGYKNKYCNAGKDGWESCKRYLVKSKTGKCPPELLPNSAKTVNEIIASMN